MIGVVIKIYIQMIMNVIDIPWLGGQVTVKINNNTVKWGTILNFDVEPTDLCIMWTTHLPFLPLISTCIQKWA